MLTRFLVNTILRLWIRPVWKRSSVERARWRFALADRLGALGRRAVQVQVETIDSFSIEWIGEAAVAWRGLIVFLHGGAFCVRGALTDRRFCADLSGRTGLPVALVAYRLAPEHRFPAGLDDCCCAYESLLARGIDPRRIVLIGHSAGGNLAVAMMMRGRRLGLPQPAGAVLLSASADLCDPPIHLVAKVKDDVMASPDIWPWVRHHYLGTSNPADPDASPMYGDWGRLPPLQFHVSAAELLHGDTLRAAARARSQGTDAEVTQWPGMPHNFVFIDVLAEAALCRQQIADFIEQACARA